MPDSPNSPLKTAGLASDINFTMSKTISLPLKEQIDRIKCDDGPQRGKSGIDN